MTYGVPRFRAMSALSHKPGSSSADQGKVVRMTANDPERSLRNKTRSGRPGALNRKIILNIFLIPLLSGGLALTHYAVASVSSDFIEMRVKDAKTFRSIIQDNWKGIQSITDEQKKDLVMNLDPELASVDIKLMRRIALVLAYALFLSLIADRANSILLEYKNRKNQK